MSYKKLHRIIVACIVVSGAFALFLMYQVKDNEVAITKPQPVKNFKMVVRTTVEEEEVK